MKIIENAVRKEIKTHGAETVKSKRVPVKSVSIIIPAYNEEMGLSLVLNNLSTIITDREEIIVVNDGSTDATEYVASKFPYKILSHRINRGKGAAIKTGISAARGENIILIDADNTYPVEYLHDIVSKLNVFDLVTGSRLNGQENIPAFNRVGNFIIRNLIKIVSGYRLHDPLTGLYGIKKCLLEQMRLRSEGFGFETELSIKAAKMKLSMTEIPINYKPRVGKAKLNGVKDGLRILITILRFAFWRPTTLKSQ